MTRTVARLAPPSPALRAHIASVVERAPELKPWQVAILAPMFGSTETAPVFAKKRRRAVPEDVQRAA